VEYRHKQADLYSAWIIKHESKMTDNMNAFIHIFRSTHDCSEQNKSFRNVNKSDFQNVLRQNSDINLLSRNGYVTENHIQNYILSQTCRIIRTIRNNPITHVRKKPITQVT
jgi:hypothetical protein